MNQQSSGLRMVKEFFYFTRSKLTIFIILALVFLWVYMQQGQTLGNTTLSGALTFLILIYLFLSAIWFSFKGKKQAIIGIALLVLFLISMKLSGDYSKIKRAEADAECRQQTSAQGITGQYINCMAAKGYHFYR